MGGRGAGKSLSVRVNFTGSANHQEGAMDRTASILMKEYPGARDTDFITVTVLRGFNLGFFARHSKRSLTMRPDEWLTRVR